MNTTKVPYSSRITIRLDEEDGKQLYDVCRSIGIEPAAAVRVFVNAFIKEGGFPFPVKQTTVVEKSHIGYTFDPSPGWGSGQTKAATRDYTPTITAGTEAKE